MTGAPDTKDSDKELIVVKAISNTPSTRFFSVSLELVTTYKKKGGFSRTMGEDD